MTTNPIWKTFFNNWPASIAKHGIMVSILNETIPFKGFMVRDDLLLLERNNPDSLGARYVMIGFDSINCVKLTDPLKESVFTTAGFLGKLENK